MGGRVTPPAARRLAVAGVVVAAFALGAFALPRSPWSADDAGSVRVVVPDLPAFFDVLVLLAVFAVLTGGALLSLAVASGMNPEQVVRRRRGSVNALILLVLAALVIVLFWSPDRSSGPTAPGTRDRSGVEATAAPPGRPDKDSSRGLGWVLSIVIAIGVAGGCVWVWRLARVQIPQDARAFELERRVRAELEAAIADLEGIADPRAAVIACYGRLRELAAASGVPVDPSDTALELLETLTERVPALAPSSARLVELFQEARFSPHTIDADMRRAALDALEEARGRLGAPA